MLCKILNKKTKAIFQIRNFPTMREKTNPLEPSDLYEPKFEVPRHYPDIPLVNIKLQSHDFQPLEKYQRYIHWAALKYKFNIIESYAVAHKSEIVKEFKPGTSVETAKYELKTFYRVVRVGPVYAIHLPLFIMFIQTHAPVGISINVKRHDATDDSERYISDPQLEDYKETLKNLDNPLIRKMLGWEA